VPSADPRPTDPSAITTVRPSRTPAAPTAIRTAQRRRAGGLAAWAAAVALCAGCAHGGAVPDRQAATATRAAATAPPGAATATAAGGLPPKREPATSGPDGWHLAPGARLQEAGPSAGHLRTLPGGIVLLQTPSEGFDDHATRPVQGSPTWTWTPAEPLPAPAAAGRHVDVFYTPHPDDETLSMGVLIAAAVRHGDRVIVVSLTDGRTTGAIRAINARLTSEHPAGTARDLTIDQVAASRQGELRRATTDLGVAAQDVVLAHLDAASSDDGAIVTVAEAEQVIRAFADRYPAATHVTMSDTAEHQQDHLDAGAALRRLSDAGVVTSAQWTVSRLWWQLPSPPWTWALPTAQDRDAVRHAGLEYQTWNPADDDYAVGFYSVRWQFTALGQDVRDRVHTTGPLTPGVTSTPGR